MDAALLHSLVFWAGVGQLMLVAGSPAIPWVLRWAEQTSPLRPLIRQVFWTYAGYILAAHLCFGLLSALAPALLLDGSPLARLVCLYTAGWWGVRLVLQFFCFDRYDAPSGPAAVVGEAALVGLFVYLTAVYALAAAHAGGPP